MDAMNEQIDRELWLSKLIEKCRPEFASQGFELPGAIRVAYGWPKSRKAIGCCFSENATSDKHFEIFISPAHHDNEPHDIAATLVHELIHTLPCCNNHGKKFKKVMAAVGLEGKATATTGGPELWEWIDQYLETLGPFPGKEIKRSMLAKKQTTRMLKCECLACGFVFRASRQAIDAARGLNDDLRCPGATCSGRIEVPSADSFGEIQDPV
jgi:SprT-like family